MGHLDEYETFRDLGKYSLAQVGHNNIWVQLFYYVKHNRHHKSRLTVDGNLTYIPSKSVYYGVVYLCGVRIPILLDGVNEIETW